MNYCAPLKIPRLIEAIKLREAGDIQNALSLFSSLEVQYYREDRILLCILYHQAVCWYYKALRDFISVEAKNDGVMRCACKIQSIARFTQLLAEQGALGSEAQPQANFLLGLSHLLNKQWQDAANLFSAAIKCLKTNDKLKKAIWTRFLCEAKFALNDRGCYGKLKFFYDIFVKEAAKIVDPTLYLSGEQVFFLRLMAKVSFCLDRNISKKYLDNGLSLVDEKFNTVGKSEYLDLAYQLLLIDSK